MNWFGLIYPYFKKIIIGYEIMFKQNGAPFAWYMVDTLDVCSICNGDCMIFNAAFAMETV